MKQDTPSGNNLAFGYLLSLSIDRLPKTYGQLRRDMYDDISTSIALCDMPIEWKAEQHRYLDEANAGPVIGNATVESIPQPGGVDQAVIHPNNHFSDKEAL